MNAASARPTTAFRAQRRLPKLRWVQALTAGVEGWLALPDLPAGVTLTCARGTHRESMSENILGALFHLAKPYAAIAEDQKRHTSVLFEEALSRIAAMNNGRTSPDKREP